MPKQAVFYGYNLYATVYLPDKAKTNPRISSGALKVQHRVAYGRDVEVKDNGGHTGLQRRTPSLDDVLSQIRGECQN